MIPSRKHRLSRRNCKERRNTLVQRLKPELELNADPNAAYKIIGTDAVGAVAGLNCVQGYCHDAGALVGILVYMAYRFEWTYGAAAVMLSSTTSW